MRQDAAAVLRMTRGEEAFRQRRRMRGDLRDRGLGRMTISMSRLRRVRTYRRHSTDSPLPTLANVG
jgi:hypothetical protein